MSDASTDLSFPLPPGFNRVDAEAWRQLAWKAIEAGRTPDAIACFREVARLAPQLVEAWANLGALLARSGQHTKSVEFYRQAVLREPQNLQLRKALVRSLRDSGDRAAALAEGQAALSLASSDAQLLQQLGNLLQELDRYDEAIEQFQRAISLEGRSPVVVNNLGVALFRRGDIDESIAHFREAIQKQFGFADAHFYLGMALLLQGDYDAGWPEYEWRPGGRCRPNPAPMPMWQGEPLAGKTLLIAAEQGLGDTIQFVRFARLVKERYRCRTILYVQQSLIPLLQSCAGIDDFAARDQPLPPVDYFIPLLSIPSVLGFNPSRESAPASYLSADPNRIAAWRQRVDVLRSNNAALRIGLSWQGDPKFPADRCRSIPLAQLAPLLDQPRCQFASLQRGFGVEQLAALERSDRIINFGDDLDRSGGAFLDTAAIMQSLDLVIASDSAVAHLAGALGVPTRVALSHVPDWRWHLVRSDSPWYPQVKLFRQSQRGEWEPVVAALSAELRARVP
jgi:Flp pilus assembly protein TadD